MLDSDDDLERIPTPPVSTRQYKKKQQSRPEIPDNRQRERSPLSAPRKKQSEKQ